jgi:PAS domain S-box-containing protein
MDIREKALTGIIVIILLFLIILASVSSSIISKNYEHTESVQVTDYTNLVVNNLRSEMNFLSTLTKSWSESDEAYSFAKGKNPGFIEKNLQARSFSRNDINFLIITNTRGEILYSQGFNDTTPQFEPVPKIILAEITSPDHPMMDLSFEYIGLVNIPGSHTPVLVASSPILHTDQSGPPAGLLIVGKYLGDDEMDRYKTDSIPSLTISTAGAGSPQPGIDDNSNAGYGSGVKISPLNEDSIQGETILKDYNGVENVRVTIVVPRTIQVQGKNALLDFLLIELSMGLVLGLFIIIFLDKIVLSRLQDISTEINMIRSSGRISGRVKITHEDEISRLENAMNLMLAHVEEAQARLIESDAKLHRAEAVAKFGHWEFSLDTKIVTASAGARMIYGLEDRELSIPDIQKVPLPQYRQELDQQLQDLIREGKGYNTEFLIQRPTDNAVIAIHSIAEYDPERNIVFGVIQDITDRKQVETALRESEERYRTLTDSLPELVLVHRNGTILYANAAVAHGVGISQADLVGRSIFEFVAAENREMIIEKSRERANGEPVVPFEAIFLAKDGQKKVGVVNSTRIRYRGEPAFLVIITDISTRKAMESALSIANKKLHMLSSITRHDIRNKILGLRSYIAIGGMSAHNDAEARLFGQMEDSARTIDEQIEFTREYQTMGMNAPRWIRIKDVVDRVKVQINLGNIEVGDECGGLEVFADPLLEKVFYNLFDNAIRYGGTITRIHVYYEKSDDGDLSLVVEDNGVGIPVEDKTDIFERGFGKNTGLGLFMIREILAITGITIRENGVQGKGARFVLEIPRGIYRLAEYRPDGGK